MPELTPWDRELIKIQDNLRDSPGVYVFKQVRESLTRDNCTIFSDRPEGRLELGPQPQEWPVQFTSIGTQWQTVDPFAHVTGEFYLTALSHSISGNEIDPSEYFDSMEEKHITQEFRIIDDAPFTGAGSFTAIRFQVKSGVDDPEMWFFDNSRGIWKMDLD